ncbi:MAG: DUF554 domain-containing protein [Chloroflexi bacterium]|nr:DUF554 domain-containing protein [Chloroflexota bacterium]
MIGTLINVGTVIVGGSLGTLLGSRLPERLRETVMHGLGLVTLVLGITMAITTKNVLVVMGSVLIGGLLGEWWNIDHALERASEWVHRQVAKKLPASSLGRFSEGLITASLVFCIGPMTLLGSIQDGLTGDYTLLAIKSLLDLFSSLIFASSLGIGVVFAALVVLVYQGAITLLAVYAQQLLTTAMINEMTATGGVMIIAIGLLLLDLKKIRVANLLPALFIAPAIVAILTALNITL